MVDPLQPVNALQLVKQSESLQHNQSVSLVHS
jgi:hypothetical protein